MSEERPRRVLVMRLSAMGDVAMTAPVVESVCVANPDVSIDFLSAPFHEPFFRKLPNLRFVGTDIKKQKGGLWSLLKLFWQLKANGYDTVVDLHDVLRTKVLRWLFRLSGVGVYALDKGRAEKRALVDGSCRQQLPSMVERYASVFRAAGLHKADGSGLRSREALPATCPVREKGEELWVGVSPFAQHAGKMYPAEKMAEVLKLLVAREGVRVFVFGGGATEKAKAADLIGVVGCGEARIHNMIGLMRLSEEMALMSNLDVMLSMDSSAMHVSSLYGVRVVSVWGATHPYAGFLGYGQKVADVVQREDLDCRPCSIFGNKPCKFGDYRCFDIPAERVAERVLGVVC